MWLEASLGKYSDYSKTELSKEMRYCIPVLHTTKVCLQNSESKPTDEVKTDNISKYQRPPGLCWLPLDT